MTTSRDHVGIEGERLAERCLLKKGFKLVARRYLTPVGELDLVMRDRDTLVFVEVKTQSDSVHLDPHERVTHTKRTRLTRAARWFVGHRRCEDAPCRFDVVSIVIPAGGVPRVEHFPDAFAPRSW